MVFWTVESKTIHFLSDAFVQFIYFSSVIPNICMVGISGNLSDCIALFFKGIVAIYIFGRLFVKIYYAASPTLARWLKKDGFFTGKI
jgi:hypothetical protein